MENLLCLQNPYKRQFTANVKKKLSDKKIILDKTYFYPEGGGQPGDTGLINKTKVVDTQLENHEIVHILEKPLMEENDLECEVDWEKRSSFMQQHTGQHILSRIFEITYNADTVGFHIGDDYVTIDIDQKINQKDLDWVEHKANQVITSNLKIKSYLIDPEEIKTLPIRNKPKVNENIRIVEIDGFDYCPCGGTHLDRTGEVGLLKIRRFSNHKDGIRIEFLCGQYALDDYHWKNHMLNNISDFLSIKPEEVENRVREIHLENIETNKKLNKLNEKLQNYKYQNILNSSKKVNDYTVVAEVFENESFKDLRYIGSKIVQENTNHLVVFINNNNNNSSNLLIGKSKSIELDIAPLFNDAIEALGGNGGGNPFMKQGGGSVTNNLEQHLESILNKII